MRFSTTKYTKSALMTAALLAVSGLANASLITNGSFEQLDFGDNTAIRGDISNTLLTDFENKNAAWDVFNQLPGWHTTYGNGIELQKNVVTSSQDGNHHIELDSHTQGSSNSMMTQVIDSLIIGQDYLVEFYYKPRTSGQNDNGINVYWHDANINFDQSIAAQYQANGTKQSTPDWQLQSMSFTATSTSMALSFASVGTANTLGGLVDNVSMVAQVSEPSALALLLAGMGFIHLRQRKTALTGEAK